MIKCVLYSVSVCLVISSCYRPTVLEFKLINLTEDSLSVVYNTIDSDSTHKIVINPGDTGVFVTTEKEYVGSLKNESQAIDSAIGFRTLRVYPDTIIFNKSDFLRKKTYFEVFHKKSMVYLLAGARIRKEPSLLTFTLSGLKPLN